MDKKPTSTRVRKRRSQWKDSYHLGSGIAAAPMQCDLPPELEALRHQTDDPHEAVDILLSVDL